MRGRLKGKFADDQHHPSAPPIQQKSNEHEPCLPSDISAVAPEEECSKQSVNAKTETDSSWKKKAQSVMYHDGNVTIETTRSQKSPDSQQIQITVNVQLNDKEEQQQSGSAERIKPLIDLDEEDSGKGKILKNAAKGLSGAGKAAKHVMDLTSNNASDNPEAALQMDDFYSIL